MDSLSPPKEHGPGWSDSEDPSVQPKSVNRSEALFRMYLERPGEGDRETTERWKRECDAMLIFTGLFSASLTSLIRVSIQDLQVRPNSLDTSTFYLTSIYHLLTNTTSPLPTLVSAPADPTRISPPKYAILVNSLWFLSLVTSLTGALLAVFIQQWAQSYLHATQEQHSPHDRARIRAFYAEGINKLHLPWLTRAVPTLIHISLVLFFLGLPIFLFHIDRTVFNAVITWLGLCVAGLACATLMPIFCQASPYYSILSSSVWVCVTTTLFVVYRLLRSLVPLNSPVFRWYNSRYSNSPFRWLSLDGMREAAERSALQLSSDIDYRALSWMFGTLNYDDEFEEFFDALPGLCESEALTDPLGGFVKPNEKILSRALIGMMDRTLSSDVIPKSVKRRRVIICTKVIDATSLLRPWWVLRRVLLGDWHGFSRSIQFGLFAQGLKDAQDHITVFYAEYVVAFTIATLNKRDDLWFQLTSRHLNVSKYFLQNHLSHCGDSSLLANAVFIVQRTIQTYSGSPDHHRSDILAATSRTLGSLCKFHIRDTFPEQQHEFCHLWNQLVEVAQSDSHPYITPLFTMTLKSIRGLYITLHEHTNAYPTAFAATTDDEDPVLDDATSYPMCTIFGHRPSVSVRRLQLDESYPDTTGHTPPAIPGPDPEYISHILQDSYALAMLSPSPKTMPLPSLSPADPAPQILKFTEYGEFSGLLYHSPYTVLYQDELYPTALHLFEARKFLDRRPDLADRIRECERVEDLTLISAQLAGFKRRDWDNVGLSIMDEVLHLRFCQHSDLCVLLLDTYPAELVYVESGDTFWGDGAGSGMNELGKSLMRVRERLRAETGPYSTLVISVG